MPNTDLWRSLRRFQRRWLSLYALDKMSEYKTRQWCKRNIYWYERFLDPEHFNTLTKWGKNRVREQYRKFMAKMWFKGRALIGRKFDFEQMRKTYGYRWEDKTHAQH